MNEPPSGRTTEINILRRRLDDQQMERLAHLETRLDHLDERIHAELSTLDNRIEHKLMQAESRIAERAVGLAVTQAFGHLGVDVEDPKDLERFRDDLRFGGLFRSAASRGFSAVVATVCGGIGVSVWLAFKDHLDIQGLLKTLVDWIIGVPRGQ